MTPLLFVDLVLAERRTLEMAWENSVAKGDKI
jgi:hypothetical protein